MYLQNKNQQEQTLLDLQRIHTLHTQRQGEMAVIHGSYFPSTFTAKLSNYKRKTTKPPPVPTFISTNLSDINPFHLRDLYRQCNHSPHRFPVRDIENRVEPVEVNKLSIALSNSTVVVSVFTKPEFDLSEESLEGVREGADWFQRLMPLSPANGRLIGFGRAVSDFCLTASIYDVMVIPEFQRGGIGRRIVQKIIRSLTNRGIYDIAALCSEEERPFFKACGFGNDIMGSTTMMYTRTSSSSQNLNFRLMGKIWVEICLISARGMRRTSALWKLQWFAVGWIDPNNKYCTKIDASGNANPVWKTKFSIAVDSSESNFDDLALHVEVYSREPIFLRERLQGTAAIVLKEFLDKYSKNSDVSKAIDEVGSFQLRKRNSNKPQGFVDVSIRISEKEEESDSFPGDGEGFKLHDRRNNNNLANPYGPAQSYPPKLPVTPSSQHAENDSHENLPYKHPTPFPTKYANTSAGGPSYQSPAGPSYQPQLTPRPPPSAAGPHYQPPRTPPPPPPPSNVGYISTFNPRTDNLPPSYINMPSSGAAPGLNSRPGLGLGLGAGALAAGAVIFGDDFMSGYDLPIASLNISTDLPF